MWYLTTSTGSRLYLKPNKVVTFGRKKTDILLQNDESISRYHALIDVKPKEEIKADEPISTCVLRDAQSKYGTYIICSETEQTEVSAAGTALKNGDKIRFGLQQHVFKVVYVPLITVVSTFQNAEKEKLQRILDEIDGMMTNNWTSACTHLTVLKAALTEKVTWAMASAVPIVNLNFWEAVKEAIDSGEKLPDPAKFIPPISESLINREAVSLCANEKRKTLFRDLIFVHFSVSQYKMYGKMIHMAGGKSILYWRRPLSAKEICAPHVIVLQYSDSDTTQSIQDTVPEYETLYNALRENKRKMISETDIPLAILHCSIEKYCNPKYRFEELLKRTQPKPDSSKVLVLDTQDLTNDVRLLPKIISNVPIRTGYNIEKSSQNVLIPESCSLTVLGSVASQSEDRTIISTSKTSQGRKNTVNAQKYIPETKDSYDTQELLVTSMPKKSQDRKTTVNSEISIESRPAQKIKEVVKAAKYIPETKDSYDTQDLLVTSMPKRSQDRKTTVNSEISIESRPAQKIEEVVKAAKYIPETKDSYDTQDLSRISTSKRRQDRKTTVNSEISIESRPAQKIEEVVKAAKYIPETKDSYDTQDLSRINTSKTRQDRNTTVNSEISIESRSAQKIEEVIKAAKYISETKDSYDTQDLSRINTSKRRQDRNTTVNSEISIESRPAQKIEEVIKAAKYISETKDSYDTQDLLRTGTLKASQDRKNTINTEVPVEGAPAPKIKEVQKAVKYIPESKDLYDTQSILRTGTINASPVAKSTPIQTQNTLEASTSKKSQNERDAVNSDISIERTSIRRMIEVCPQKTVEYISETKDSYDTQDLLRTSTLKASQDRKNTINTEVPVEGVPAPKIKEVQKAVKYIPESKDLYDTQSILRSGTINASPVAKSTPIQTQNTLEASTSKKSQNERDAVNSDISIERTSIQRMKEVFSRKTVEYISESSDSSELEEMRRVKTPNTSKTIKSTSESDVLIDSIDKKSTQKVIEVNSQRPLKRALETNDSSDDIEKGAQHSSQRSQCVTNKCRTLQEISRMKESMIANKGTPANDVIELLDDEDDDEEEENKLEELLLSRGRSNIHPDSILSPQKLSKLVHDHSIRVNSPEVNRHCTPLSRADNNHSTKTVSQIEKESVTQSKKRNRSFDESDENVEDVLTLTRKKSCPDDNTVTTAPVTSSNTVKSPQAENHNNLLRNNTSSLPPSINFKKFKKVYNKIPQQRITLNDMYIWNMFNVQNL